VRDEAGHNADSEAVEAGVRRRDAGGVISDVVVVVGYALRESLRRKVFLIVVLLSAAFLALYGIGAWRAFRDTSAFVSQDQFGLDSTVVTGATVLGLAMFATLFLGTVRAIFHTLGVVRGDAERGLLQPLVVRPLGRSTLLLARFLAAAAVCAFYVTVLFAAETVITGLIGGWWPDRVVLAGAELAYAVAVVVALSLLGSVFLSATANGIAVFMVFGGGLVAGLLAQIGRAIGSDTLRSIGRWASWVLPFEALYQDALHVLTAGTSGFDRFALELGPFGGSEAGGVGVRLWAVAYLALVGTAGLAAFARRDLS
jgi:ABC-type transport system involved in multi-copper enzyme maturation permease subunit